MHTCLPYRRNLEHSTILYEDTVQRPLLRLCWNKQDPNYLATFAMDSNEVSLCLTYYATCSGEQNEVSLSSFATFITVHCLLLYCLVKKLVLSRFIIQVVNTKLITGHLHCYLLRTKLHIKILRAR